MHHSGAWGRQALRSMGPNSDRDDQSHSQRSKGDSWAACGPSSQPEDSRQSAAVTVSPSASEAAGVGIGTDGKEASMPLLTARTGRRLTCVHPRVGTCPGLRMFQTRHVSARWGCTDAATGSAVWPSCSGTRSCAQRRLSSGARSTSQGASALEVTAEVIPTMATGAPCAPRVVYRPHRRSGESICFAAKATCGPTTPRHHS
jgi:hypothetical protein